MKVWSDFWGCFFFFWLLWVFITVHGLSCPIAYGILVPQPGIDPTLEGIFLTTGPPEKSLSGVIFEGNDDEGDGQVCS